MSIFNNARNRDSHRYVLDTIKPVEVAFSTGATGATRPTIDRHQEWVVSLTISQNYWANQAQRQDFEKAAIRCLAAELYQDVLRELPRLRLAIQSGDKQGAFEAVDRIEKATQP